MFELTGQQRQDAEGPECNEARRRHAVAGPFARWVSVVIFMPDCDLAMLIYQYLIPVRINGGEACRP